MLAPEEGAPRLCVACGRTRGPVEAACRRCGAGSPALEWYELASQHPITALGAVINLFAIFYLLVALCTGLVVFCITTANALSIYSMWDRTAWFSLAGLVLLAVVGTWVCVRWIVRLIFMWARSWRYSGADASGQLDVFAGRVWTGSGEWTTRGAPVQLPDDVPDARAVQAAGPDRIAAALGPYTGAQVLLLAAVANLVARDVLRVSFAELQRWELRRSLLRPRWSHTRRCLARDLRVTRGQAAPPGSSLEHLLLAEFTRRTNLDAPAAADVIDPYRAVPRPHAAAASLPELPISEALKETLRASHDAAPALPHADPATLAASLAAVIATSPSLARRVCELADSIADRTRVTL